MPNEDGTADWIHGDPEERPTMSLRGAESTDWMATASLDTPKDLTDDEYQELRRAQRKRRKTVAEREGRTRDEIRELLTEFDGEHPETRAEAIADAE